MHRTPPPAPSNHTVGKRVFAPRTPQTCTFCSSLYFANSVLSEDEVPERKLWLSVICSRLSLPPLWDREGMSGCSASRLVAPHSHTPPKLCNETSLSL